MVVCGLPHQLEWLITRTLWLPDSVMSTSASTPHRCIKEQGPGPHPAKVGLTLHLHEGKLKLASDLVQRFHTPATFTSFLLRVREVSEGMVCVFVGVAKSLHAHYTLSQTSHTIPNMLATPLLLSVVLIQQTWITFLVQFDILCPALKPLHPPPKSRITKAEPNPAQPTGMPPLQ